MYGEQYLLIETVDPNGRRCEQWVADQAMADQTELVDPALDELAKGCNTDKDRYKRKTKIAGINVVTFPCGTILSIEELFGCESLSQVLLPVYSLMNLPSLRQSVQGNFRCVHASVGRSVGLSVRPSVGSQFFSLANFTRNQ